MHDELLLAFVVVFALDSVTPGPAVAMVMSRGASIGLTRTLPLVAGLVLGDLFLFGLALAGLAALAAALGPLFALVKWLGVAWLLYLAWRLWTADVTTPIEASDRAGEGWRGFAMGTILPLGNPKAVGFYAALLPTVMDVGALSLPAAVQFAAAIVLVWGGTLVGYAALADRGRRHLSAPSARRWLNRGAAGAMAGAAGAIAVRD